MTASQEEEARVRAKLSGEMRNMSNDIDHLREQLEEEQEARAELQRSLTKANNEVVAWKQKYESGEGNVRYVSCGKSLNFCTMLLHFCKAIIHCLCCEPTM